MLKLARTPAESADFCQIEQSKFFDEDEHPFARKIKPVDGLMLKTAIAFRKDSDPDMIPIRKEGMAVCENCGAIGVKHSFYTKEKRFCSQSCAKNFNENPHQDANTSDKRHSLTGGLQPGQQPANRKLGQPLEDVHVFSNKKQTQHRDKYGFDWVEMLTEFGFVTPPVSCFRHSPLCESWALDVSVGMKVEVENTDTRKPGNVNGEPQSESYWVASVVSLMGYKAQLRYEGFGDDDSKDFWVNLAAEDVHPVGWCASRGKPLIPPRTIQDKHSEWRDFLVKRLTGARSLPNQFHSRVVEACRSRFKIGTTVEIIDRTCLSMIKVATVDTIIGRRLRLHYVDSPSDDPSAYFWCHEESSMLHPVGWALSVGHHIDASAAYMARCAKKALLPTDATAELFNELRLPSGGGVKFKEGMKLEAVDPLNLDSICVATVVRVLKHGYLMIRIDRCKEEVAEDGEDADSGLFCYHSTSACIAPPGFCEANAITLKPPEDYEGRFRWGDYLRQTKAPAAPEALFEQQQQPQLLRVGMRVEAADLMDPRLVCVATIAQVAGRLVRVHFDGWSDDFDQWMDSASPEIYPVGWCELAGYRLETPEAGNVHSSSMTSASGAKKGRKSSGRGGAAKGGGKSRSAATRSRSATKRERSPSMTEEAELQAAAAPSSKTAKPSPSLTNNNRKSQEPTPVAARSLRARSNQSPADITPASPAVGSQPTTPQQQPPPKTTKRGSAGTAVSKQPPPAEVDDDNDPIKRAKTVESYFRAAGKAAVLEVVETAGAPTTDALEKRIPRLIDVNSANRRNALVGVTPLEWSTADVAEFLRVNDCAAYCDHFTKAMVDGRKFVSMTRENVLQLLDKVGPTVKIYDLVCQLRERTSVKPNANQNLHHQSPLR